MSAKYGLEMEGTRRPIVCVLLVRKFFAIRFGVYPHSSAAFFILFIVSCEMRLESAVPFKTLETVDLENPLFSAIVLSVVFIGEMLLSCAKICKVVRKSMRKREFFSQNGRSH